MAGNTFKQPDSSTELSWSPFVHLAGCWRGGLIPAEAGLYRIRRVGRDDLDYIGQTGKGTMNLRRRLAMLRGIWLEEMPYRDPHTVAPALWALRTKEVCDFEVSIVALPHLTQQRRLAQEAIAIAEYRQTHGKSPTLNWGRMPQGFRMSSGNNAELERRGKRFRGGPCLELQESHLPSLAPLGQLDGDFMSHRWCSLAWTAWTAAHDAIQEERAEGLYRLRNVGASTLLYIGQGRITERLRSHRRKEMIGSNFEVSWTAVDCHQHQRLELENDLIAAYALANSGDPPVVQFQAR